MASRKPYWAAVPAALALAAAGVRWLLQGSGNVWTDVDRRFYLPDPDLGWRLGKQTVPWLGLEVVGILAGIMLAVLAGAWLVARRERKRAAAWRPARIALWVIAALPLAVPLWAFASGGRPAGGRDALPTGAAIVVGSGVSGGLALPAGRWTVRAVAGSSLVASVAAGGERFDVRFGETSGEWRGDPRDLTQTMQARLAAGTRAVDTGIDLRSTHTREYLQADKFPDIVLTLRRLDGARPEGDGLAFAASGELTLMGQPVPVSVTGTLRAADAAARARLGVGDAQALLLQASFTLDLRTTALAGSVSEFDSPQVTVTASLVLVHVPVVDSKEPR